MHFKYGSPSRKVPFTSINSEARLGYFVSQDTFSVSVFELKSLNRDDPKATAMIEMLKLVIETQEARATMSVQSTPKAKFAAFRQLNFSSNAKPPIDPAFNTRIIKLNFTQKDRHTEEEKKEFHELMNKYAHRLLTLGDFVIGYIHEHPEILFKEDKANIDWEECAKDIIANFYESTGLVRPSDWLDISLGGDVVEGDDYELDEINNITDALRTVFLNHFNEVYNRYIRNLAEQPITDSNERPIEPTRIKLTLRERISFCIEQEITPYFIQNKKGTLIIPNSIFNLLHAGGIESDRIGSLRQLSEILEMECGVLKIEK